MGTGVLTAVVSGVFSIATGMASVWLKHYLEHRPLAQQPRKPKTYSPSTTWSARRPLILFLAGFFLGVTSRAIRPIVGGDVYYESIASIALLGGACVVLAWNHGRSKHGFWLYQLETLTLWAAYDCGWSAVQGGVWSELVIDTAAIWLACALVGGALTAIAGRIRRTT
jgi:hypothetical protein